MVTTFAFFFVSAGLAYGSGGYDPWSAEKEGEPEAVRPTGSIRRVSSRFLPVLVPFLIVLLGGCSESPSILDGVSSDARRIERLWWVMLGTAGLVFAFVLFLMIGSLIRSKNREADIDPPDRERGRRLVFWAGLVGTSVILIAIFGLSTFDLRALSQERDASLHVSVTGELWWWRVDYGSGVVTANEIHIPAGEDVAVELTSGDVIHSFWVPESGPKRDMIPGQTNTLDLMIEEPGTYRGICSEFCGLEHARMQFLVVAHPAEEFDSWLAAQAEPAAEPASPSAERGREVFLTSQCVGCHTIRGVAESGVRGPDLTHLASRQTIGAAAFDLTHENLLGFVADPGSMKPGVLMPPAGLSDDDLADLVAFLQGLK